MPRLAFWEACFIYELLGPLLLGPPAIASAAHGPRAGPAHIQTHTIRISPVPKKKKISPNTCPWSKSLLAEAGKLKLTEDDPELRRSIRRKDLVKDYKNPFCADKDCIILHVNLSPQPSHPL